ncbi:MAG: undecaprenyl/decaprenyl-phosphate alpha-N-acetylglucosaminyl 1-phosphate transferase [Planctomycetes bacterium]|nr:undecaprenyl/decaprenyl-phosphate alpha-N-acetylglucosaminyl 1-phosphate transferase [Planctomycetota bacterium]
MTSLVLILFAASAVVSLVLTGALVRIGQRAGVLDTAGFEGHDKELRSVPNIGGIAIWATLVLPLAGGLIAMQLAPDAITELIPSLAPWKAQIAESTPLATAFLVCLTTLHVVGLIDDRKPLGVLPKTLIQLGCALALVVWFDIRLLSVLDTWLGTGSIISISCTVIWIMVLTNAMNYLDNMDGVTAGITIVSGGLFMIAALMGSQWFVGAMLALLVGGNTGFFWWNKPKAKIFMGDGGSLVIGFALAVLVTRVTWFDPEATSGIGTAWYGVLMPIFVLALPLYDFFTVTSIRILQGKSPFKGDQQHFSHRLAQRGLGNIGTLVVLFAISGVTGIAGLLLGRSDATGAILLTLLVCLALLVISFFDYTGRKYV